MITGTTSFQNHDVAVVVWGEMGRTPKVKIYDGASLSTGQVVMMAPAFLPFGAGLTVGTNISAGDINGDGYDDLIVSQS